MKLELSTKDMYDEVYSNLYECEKIISSKGTNYKYVTEDFIENDILMSNFSGVEEVIEMERFFKILSKIEFYPSKFWIISDTSTTSYYLSKYYKEYIDKNTSFNSELITLKTQSDLRSTLSRLQKEQTGVLIYSFQTLLDSDYGVIRSKRNSLNDMLK